MYKKVILSLLIFFTIAATTRKHIQETNSLHFLGELRQESAVSNTLPQKVIVCGVCRDVVQRLPYVIKVMEKIGDLFSDYRIIVYENNSCDNTPLLLKRWESKNTKVRAISEYLEKNTLETMFVNYPKKTEPISRARNIVLNTALSEQYQDFAYLIWLDMDFHFEPSYEGIKEVFTSKCEWDAVFAYGIDKNTRRYWDWYAFRDRQCPLGPELIGDYWWSLPYHFFSVQLDENDNWYPVYSAFSGCGIYKKSSLEGCQYSGLVTDDLGKLYHKIITENMANPVVQKYLKDLKFLQKQIIIHQPSIALPAITDQNIGIVTDGSPDDIVWRMNSDAYKYPASLDHVTLHASMIMRGHDKLFINPRLIFYYS